jgi:D-inositol-3-phosphate glycosyltransferase
VGGLPFLVQDGITGYVVPGGSPEALVSPLLKLMTQADLRKKMGQQAADYALNYSWELITKQIAETYATMLDNGNIKPIV